MPETTETRFQPRLIFDRGGRNFFVLVSAETNFKFVSASPLMYEKELNIPELEPDSNGLCLLKLL